MKINIHLISTAHRERGKCTSENLFKILNKIKPEVVFCEASTKMYKEFKIGLNQSSLELNSTKKLSENHSFYLVAIDRYPPLNANIRYQIEEIKKALERNEKFTNTQRKHKHK